MHIGDPHERPVAQTWCGETLGQIPLDMDWAGHLHIPHRPQRLHSTLRHGVTFGGHGSITTPSRSRRVDWSWQITAIHTGDAFGFPASGKPVAINGNDIMRVVNGKITEIYHVEELLKLTQQISTGAPQA
jgi:SnoaL-like polyketide cyclase